MYKTGEYIWYASFEQRETQVPCPVCNGDRTVTVILGNGDGCVVECQYCKHGYKGARGFVTEYVLEPRAEYRQITGRRIEEQDGEEKVEYRSDHFMLYADRMFDNEPEALACAVALAKKDAQAKADKPKYKNEKSYTWNAGYHTKQAEKCRKEAEYHAEKAKICKARSKE